MVFFSSSPFFRISSASSYVLFSMADWVRSISLHSSWRTPCSSVLRSGVSGLKLLSTCSLQGSPIRFRQYIICSQLLLPRWNQVFFSIAVVIGILRRPNISFRRRFFNIFRWSSVALTALRRLFRSSLMNPSVIWI